jgi:sulfur-oxidizing protein SoxX
VAGGARSALVAAWGRSPAHAAAVLFGFGVAAVGAAPAGLAGPAELAAPAALTAPTDLAAPVRIQDSGIAEVLPDAVAGDPARGRAIVANRQVGLCLLCHSGPIPEERFQGDLATDLAGAGDRSTLPQLRLRIADASRLDPDTIMPSYYRTSGLNSVAAAFEGKPILQAQQIEDVVAYLHTLKVAARIQPATPAAEASQ